MHSLWFGNWNTLLADEVEPGAIVAFKREWDKYMVRRKEIASYREGYGEGSGRV